jgi:hypothetical protein
VHITSQNIIRILRVHSLNHGALEDEERYAILTVTTNMRRREQFLVAATGLVIVHLAIAFLVIVSAKATTD